MVFSQQPDTGGHAQEPDLPGAHYSYACIRATEHSVDRVRKFDSTDKWRVCFCTDESNGDGGKETSLAEGMLSMTMGKAILQDVHVLIWFGPGTTRKKNQQKKAK